MYTKEETEPMNHFFDYAKGAVNPDAVFYDSDYVEQRETEKGKTVVKTGTNPEYEEASRFINGDNIAFEEVFFNNASKGGVHYVAYLHTRRKIDVNKLRKIISDEIEKRMKEDFTYRLTVEKDSTTYSKSNQDYIVKIET